MTRLKPIFSTALVVPAILGLLVVSATAAPSVPRAEAHVGEAAARAVALKVRPGRVTDAELEREGGGSGLRWSFDIAANGKTYEVGVDASDGAVLENKAEGRNPD